MSDCPVTCPMHARALRWLERHDWATLREFLPVFERMAPSAWRGCRCRILARIQRAMTARMAA